MKDERGNSSYEQRSFMRRKYTFLASKFLVSKIVQEIRFCILARDFLLFLASFHAAG